MALAKALPPAGQGLGVFRRQAELQRTPRFFPALQKNTNLLTENADKVVAKAVKLGAAPKGPVMDMFWGDRCRTVVDPEGYAWMIATHVAEPTPQETEKRMKDQMFSQPVASQELAAAATTH